MDAGEKDGAEGKFLHLPTFLTDVSSLIQKVMASTHPLEITEILLYVASYVSVKSLPACARVSKAWYQAFIPAIWKEITYGSESGRFADHPETEPSCQIICSRQSITHFLHISESRLVVC